MKRRRVSITAICLAFILVLGSGSLIKIRGQQPSSTTKARLEMRFDSLCTGFISDVPVTSGPRVVGSGKELQSYGFAERDLIYINKGLEQGVSPGALYTVVRPFGLLKQPFGKRNLGYYVKQLGVVRIETVQSLTAKAKILETCDDIWLGDLLVPYEPPENTNAMEALVASRKPVDDIIPDPSATTGQIVLGRGFKEYMGTNDIAFIDIGAAKGLHAGDSFTIYRTFGPTEGVMVYPDYKIQSDREGGYESNRYHGGDYSVDSPSIPSDKVRRGRPILPRKVVGQLVLIRVDKTASVGRIVQTSEEVNVGDSVQLNNN